MTEVVQLPNGSTKTDPGEFPNQFEDRISIDANVAPYTVVQSFIISATDPKGSKVPSAPVLLREGLSGKTMDVKANLIVRQHGQVLVNGQSAAFDPNCGKLE